MAAGDDEDPIYISSLVVGEALRPSSAASPGGFVEAKPGNPAQSAASVWAGTPPPIANPVPEGSPDQTTVGVVRLQLDKALTPTSDANLLAPGDPDALRRAIPGSWGSGDTYTPLLKDSAGEILDPVGWQFSYTEGLITLKDPRFRDRAATLTWYEYAGPTLEDTVAPDPGVPLPTVIAPRYPNSSSSVNDVDAVLRLNEETYRWEGGAGMAGTATVTIYQTFQVPALSTLSDATLTINSPTGTTGAFTLEVYDDPDDPPLDSVTSGDLTGDSTLTVTPASIIAPGTTGQIRVILRAGAGVAVEARRIVFTWVSA